MDQKREYFLRFACVQSHFLRTGYKSKIDFLYRLLDAVETSNTISILLAAVSQASGKLGMYLKVMTSTTFIYDKTFRSHNRSMDEKTLKLAQDEDVEWFHGLVDSEKIPVIIGLIRMTNGAIILKIQERLRLLLNQKITLPNEQIVERTPKHSLVGGLDQKLNSLVCGDGDFEELRYDPEDPFTIEVERLKSSWNRKFQAYVSQVEANELKSALKKAKSVVKKKKKKGKKANQDETKKKKKKKEKKEKDPGSLDMVLMLKKNIQKFFILMIFRFNCYLFGLLNES